MADKKKVRVLFIEDDNLLRTLFTELFNLDQDYEYDSSSADDIKSGLTTLETFKPHAIILDMILPYDKNSADKSTPSEDMGFSFLTDIKKKDGYKDIPVIVFSNLNDAATQNKAKSLGAFEYLVKSATTPDKFMEVLKRALATESIA